MRLWIHILLLYCSPSSPHRLTIDDTSNAFLQYSKEELEQALAHCASHKPCVACGFTEIQEQKELWLPLPDGGFVHQGIDFHVNDFVYIHNAGSGNLLDIGQITKFISDESSLLQELEVNFYGHYDLVAKKDGSHGLKQLDNVSNPVTVGQSC